MNVYFYSQLLPIALAASLVGCKKGDTSQTSANSAQEASVAPPAGLDLSASSAGSSDMPGSSSSARASAIPAPAVDLNTADRPLDARGNPMSDLEMLNLALESYRMGAGAGSAGMATTLAGRKPQGPAEEAEAFAAAAAPKASINDINDLVKLGLIKAIPTPPDGKQYTYENGVIVLKDKK